ncbi:G1 family glutamic endopeptidase [Kitasatospora sp. NPDC052896]|uniref:G1 family glutamic endopeptidase n=1 Tax=Kitasatospora sp. NPDC052896 TaxID=3364061 RepID=UPI0037C69614
MSTFRAKAVPAALAALLTVSGFALAAPASAATPTATHAAAGHFRYGNPSHHRFDGGSNWGGYIAQGSNFQSISGSWTMPQVQCNTSNDLFAPWIGIDGYGSQTVEQTGVQVDCSSGSPVYSGWYEMYPAAPVYWGGQVNAGDVFNASVTTDGSGNYTLTLTDTTQGWTQNTQQYLDAQNVSAEAVIESPSQSYPSFNKLDFSNLTVNDQVFDNSNPQAIDSGQYTETPLQNGAFSIVPAGNGGF